MKYRQSFSSHNVDKVSINHKNSKGTAFIGRSYCAGNIHIS